MYICSREWLLDGTPQESGYFTDNCSVCDHEVFIEPRSLELSQTVGDHRLVCIECFENALM